MGHTDEWLAGKRMSSSASGDGSLYPYFLGLPAPSPTCSTPSRSLPHQKGCRVQILTGATKTHQQCWLPSPPCQRVPRVLSEMLVCWQGCWYAAQPPEACDSTAAVLPQHDHLPHAATADLCQQRAFIRQLSVV